MVFWFPLKWMNYWNIMFRLSIERRQQFENAFQMDVLLLQPSISHDTSQPGYNHLYYNWTNTSIFLSQLFKIQVHNWCWLSDSSNDRMFIWIYYDEIDRRAKNSNSNVFVDCLMDEILEDYA